LPATLLQVPYFQQKIAHITTNYLEEKTGTEVKIRRIDFQLFNRLILKEVYMEDQSGDILLTAKGITAGFDFIPLFKKKFHFSSVQIYTFNLNLSKETAEAPLNIQYIIDAFQNKDKKKEKTNIDLNIKNLSLGHGNFTYRIKNKISTPGRFNPDDIRLSDISAKINLKELTNARLEAYIKRLSFVEKSGLEVKHLTFDLAADTTKATINQLSLQLPRSNLLLTNIEAVYENVNPGNYFAKQVQINLRIEPSNFHLKDISPAVPVFSHFRETIEIQGTASGTFNDFNLNHLRIKEKNDVMIEANVNIGDLTSPNPADIYVNGNIIEARITQKGIQKMANNFSPEQQVHLPEQIERLGNVSLNGEIFGCLNSLTTYVNFKTEVGNLRADVHFGREKTGFLKGKISSPEINMKELMNNADFGIAKFEIGLNATFDKRMNATGHIDALLNQFEYKSYNYENISLLGDFTPDSFKGLLNIDSREGQLTANGNFLFKGKDSEFNFSAKATDLLLGKLNLTRKYKDMALSFDVDAATKGNDIDNLAGNIAFHKIKFVTEREIYPMGDLSIDVSENENKKQLILNSAVVNGKIEGFYSLKTLPEALQQSLASYLPSLIPPVQHCSKEAKNNFELDFTIHDTEVFSSVFKLPVVFYNKSRISGEYNGEYNKFWLEAYFPRLKAGGSLIEGGRVELDNRNNGIELKLNGATQPKKSYKLLFSADFKALNDSLYSFINWKDNNGMKYKGNLDFTTRLALPEGNYPVSASIQFQPSELVFNDSVWTLSPATVEYREGRLSINQLEANHNKQKINIEGNISRDVEDEVSISLSKVDLDYIFKSLNIKALTFGGIATGSVTAKDVYKTRELSTGLDITGFSFNDVVLGNLDLKGRWDDEKQGVEMKGNIVRNDTSRVFVDGMIYPVKEELSIIFDAHNTTVAFLRKYLDKVVQGLSGEATGRMRLFGDLNNPTVEGDVLVKNGSFGVEFLNTRYTFNDWIRCTPDKISITNVTFHDKFGNGARGTGSVHHKLLDDFRFSADITYDDFLIFNATSRTNPLFYGTVFGSGIATLKGDEKTIAINVSLHNTENTFLTLDFMKEMDVADYNFINFITPEKDSIPGATPGQAAISASSNSNNEKSGTEIDLDLTVVTNNDATVEIIMDPLTGDKISGTGTGNLRIQYGTKTPVKVNGNYEIEKGKYNFSFQQAFFRNFEIEEGSKVTFGGDPLTNTRLEIKAAYRVTANLEDLDQQLLQSTNADGSDRSFHLSARNNIPVNCVLLLSGPLEQPRIQFDLELPGATSELNRQVKSYIRTEDMMNRQVVYLLVMGRFYTAPEFTRSESRTSNDLSYLTATLSSQISSMLGTLSDNFQIGTKFHQSYEGEEYRTTEVDLLLSSTLFNNRLIINGNFGYIDNPYLTNNVPLIGDFDVEYKLTKSGEIRLKGFNRYNYRNYYSLTPELTQGVGVLLRRDFNSLNDLFRRKKDLPVIPLQPDSTTSLPEFLPDDFSLIEK
jgi:hypothetical protein